MISTSGMKPRKVGAPREKTTGFENIQPTPPRSNLPQRTRLYQNRISRDCASSRVISSRDSSSGLGPVLILSNQLNPRSLSKNLQVLLARNLIRLASETSNRRLGWTLFAAPCRVGSFAA